MVTQLTLTFMLVWSFYAKREDPPRVLSPISFKSCSFPPPTSVSPPPNKLIILTIVCIIVLGSRPSVCISGNPATGSIAKLLVFPFLPGASTQGSRKKKEQQESVSLQPHTALAQLSVRSRWISNDYEVLPFLLFSMPLVLFCLLFLPGWHLYAFPWADHFFLLQGYPSTRASWHLKMDRFRGLALPALNVSSVMDSKFSSGSLSRPHGLPEYTRKLHYSATCPEIEAYCERFVTGRRIFLVWQSRGLGRTGGLLLKQMH